MPVRPVIAGIESAEGLQSALAGAQYLAGDDLATAGYLALALGKPLLLEGAPGVGKTEAAKAMGAVLSRQVVRLQCYEGLDAASAVYEWNFPAQMVAIRTAVAHKLPVSFCDLDLHGLLSVEHDPGARRPARVTLRT